MHKHFLFILFTCLLLGIDSIAQDLSSSLQVRNSHLWRGLEVATGLVYTADIKIKYKGFYGGFWSAGDANGTYKEFNNFIGYKKNKLTLELWDIYNFSPNATYNNKEYFNYDARSTGRFWDLRSFYKISEKIPLELSWNTVIYGRDLNADKTKNKYTSFVSLEYPIYKKESIEVNARAGYAFALNQAKGEKSNFLATHAGVNEVSLILSKEMEFQGYKFPLGIWAMWNTVDNNAFLQFSVELYSF